MTLRIVFRSMKRYAFREVETSTLGAFIVPNCVHAGEQWVVQKFGASVTGNNLFFVSDLTRVKA